MLLFGPPQETEPLELPDISGVESPLLLALPHISQRSQKVSIRTCLGDDEIAVSMPFLESPDGGHKLVQVPTMESAVE
jgi:hypothetical protein